jgi:CHAT domain-containing protein
MEAFYDHLLAMPPASPIQATRAAMLAVRRRPEFATPLYWARFILHGDGWESIVL